jgi:hypothetical protein
MTDPSVLRFQEYIGVAMLMHPGTIILPVRDTRGVPIAGAGATLEFSINRHMLSCDFSDCPPSSLDHAFHTMFSFKKLNFPAVDRFIVSPTAFIGWQDTVAAAPWVNHNPANYFTPLAANPLGLCGLPPFPAPPAMGHISRSLCSRAYGHLCNNGSMNGFIYRSLAAGAPAAPHLPAFFVLCVRKHAPAAPTAPAMGGAVPAANQWIRTVFLEDLVRAGLLTAELAAKVV